MRGELRLRRPPGERDAAADRELRPFPERALDRGDARVSAVGRLVDLLRLEHAVRHEQALDRDDADDVAALVLQRELLPFADLASPRRGHRERDRDREEDAAREPATANDGEVVVLTEEAFERRQRAGRDELRVRSGARVERDHWERARAREHVARLGARHEAIHERAAVRWNGRRLGAGDSGSRERVYDSSHVVHCSRSCRASLQSLLFDIVNISLS